MSALAEVGIRLRREVPGEHRAACPECARAKPRRSDDALAVRLEPDGGATWICHRCAWRGALRADDDRPFKARSATTSFRVVTPEPASADDVVAIWGRCRPIE